MKQPEPAPGAISLVVHRRNIRLWRSEDLTEPPVPGVPAAPRPKPPKPQPNYPDPPPRPKLLPVLRRPAVRGDCLPGGFNAQRPCAFAACRHSLLVDIDCDSAEVRETAEDPRDLPASCSLDVADLVDGEDRTVILRKLEPYFLVTRELVRQLELRALDGLRRGMSRARGDYKLERITRSPWGTARREKEAAPEDED